MADKFQDIRHRHVTYDRPNEDWVCGLECQGKSCYLGPDNKGKCRAGMVFDGRKSGECLPRRMGGQWQCTREETHGGESCNEGPLPDGSCCRAVPRCRPAPTLRRLRGRLTKIMAVMTLALLAVLFARKPREGEHGSTAINPGQLTAAHSTLNAECAHCHSDMQLGPDKLLAMHSSEFDHRAMADSRLCLDCHQNIGGPVSRYAFDAHTMDPKKLRAKTSGQSKPDSLLQFAALMFKKSGASAEQLSCGTCHKEHHGLTADLKTFTNRQCQICHRQQFESFSHGHPTFEAVSYPASRRTRIFFDHLSHYSKHFPEKVAERAGGVPSGFKSEAPHGESLSCAACHASNGSSGTMNVVSYEKACADCHEGDTQSGNKLPVIGYPLLDMISLNEKLAREATPRSLGTWPTYAPNDFPWLILYLLPEDARTAWQRLAAQKVYLHDLTSIKNEHLSDVERVAWAIKELFRDLCANSPSETPSGLVGHAEIVRRLVASGCDEREHLINGLPPDTFDQMRDFLGADVCVKIMREVDDFRASHYPPAVPSEEDRVRKPDAPTSSGAESFAPPPADNAGESFGTPVPTVAAMPSAGGAESFAPPTAESFGAPAPAMASAGESFAPSGAAAAESFAGQAPAPTAATKEEVPHNDPLDRINWTSSGGWHQEYGTIYYKSTGHADPLLKAWLEHILEDVRDPLRLATLREGLGFDKGTLSPTTGHCLKCHTIEERRNQQGRLVGAVINWHAYGKHTTPAKSDRPLTRYNHMSHLLAADCRQCHVTVTQPPAGREYAAAFPGEGSWNSADNWFEKAGLARFHSNFEQIPKSTCAECHTPKQSGDSCLQCHAYHHPAPDGPADMLEWLRFREANPLKAGSKRGGKRPAASAAGKTKTAAAP
ncbi:MAG: hypothetical protein R3F13_00435 [Prosthecobacter sp.]